MEKRCSALPGKALKLLKHFLTYLKVCNLINKTSQAGDVMLLCGGAHTEIRRVPLCEAACVSWHVRHYIYSLRMKKCVDHNNFISQRLIPSILVHAILISPGCLTGCHSHCLRLTLCEMVLVLRHFLDYGVHHTHHNVGNCSDVLHEMSDLDSSWELSTPTQCNSKATHYPSSEFSSTVMMLYCGSWSMTLED